jgi:hypothetical protein
LRWAKHCMVFPMAAFSGAASGCLEYETVSNMALRVGNGIRKAMLCMTGPYPAGYFGVGVIDDSTPGYSVERLWVFYGGDGFGTRAVYSRSHREKPRTREAILRLRVEACDVTLFRAEGGLRARSRANQGECRRRHDLDDAAQFLQPNIVLALRFTPRQRCCGHPTPIRRGVAC